MKKQNSQQLFTSYLRRTEQIAISIPIGRNSETHFLFWKGAFWAFENFAPVQGSDENVSLGINARMMANVMSWSAFHLRNRIGSDTLRTVFKLGILDYRSGNFRLSLDCCSRRFQSYTFLVSWQKYLLRMVSRVSFMKGLFWEICIQISTLCPKMGPRPKLLSWNLVRR